MLHLPKNALSLQHQSINNESLEQGTQLNEAQLSILRLLGRMKTVEQVNELRQVISIYYAKKATEEMDALWESGEWSEEKNESILKEHLRGRSKGRVLSTLLNSHTPTLLK